MIRVLRKYSISIVNGYSDKKITGNPILAPIFYHIAKIVKSK